MPGCSPSPGRRAMPAGRGSVVKVVKHGTVVLVCAMAAGCFGSRNPDAHCNDTSEYQDATEVPAIVIPQGMTPPPESGTFAIPASKNAAGQKGDPRRVPGAACLERPPDFFPKDAMPASK